MKKIIILHITKYTNFPRESEIGKRYNTAFFIIQTNKQPQIPTIAATAGYQNYLLTFLPPFIHIVNIIIDENVVYISPPDVSIEIFRYFCHLAL